MNSEIKKKPIKPRKPRKPKTTKRKMTKDKSVKQNVNVNVTSSGGGGSGGASVPSAQPSSYHPMMYQASQAEKEANKGLLRSLEQLTKKQDDISALVRSLEKKPEDIQIKEEIKDKLKDEQKFQNNIDEDIFNSINSDLEATRGEYGRAEELALKRQEDEAIRKAELIRQIKSKYPDVSIGNNTKLETLENKYPEFLKSK